MKLTRKWSVCLKNNILGAADVMSPTIDAYDPAAFYISDGWNTAYGAMRLRKLSLETGEELANALVRSAIRYIDVNPDTIYALLDKRILKLDRKDLRILENHTQRIPRYCDYMDCIDTDTLLLINYYTGVLQFFNLQTQKCRRKKLGAQYSFYDVKKANADTFLIFHETAVYQYSSKTNTVKKLIDTEPCVNCALEKSGCVYLLCQEPVQKICEDGKSVPYSSKMLVYPSLPENNFKELVLGCIANYFWLSEEEQFLYLAKNQEFWVYSMSEKKLIFHHIFDNAFVYNVFVQSGSILTYNRENHNLSCYKLQI